MEVVMVLVLAKVKVFPELGAGEMGEVDDVLARSAVRNGYAELIGRVENYDDWMYHGAELIVSQGRESKPKTRRRGKPDPDSAKIVSDTEAM